MCDIQGNLHDGSQVVVSVIFENKCDSFIKSMEFNVMDSLNSKLQRPEGAGPHDSLTVPFQLPPGEEAGETGRRKKLWRLLLKEELNSHPNNQIPSLHSNESIFSLSCSSGISNEARFIFSVQSIVMPQKLKGTLTFIVKVS